MCFKVDIDTSSLDHIEKYMGKAYAAQVAAWRLGQGRLVNAFSFPLLPALITEQLIPTGLSWGLLPSWTTPEKVTEIRKMTLNARCETIFEKPSFRDSAPTRRCIIVTTGFYEYRHEGTQKIKYLITRRDGDALLIGGLWSEWHDQKTGTIITMPANELMRFVHNSKERMPVIISPADMSEWLDSHHTNLTRFFTPNDDLEIVAEIIK